MKYLTAILLYCFSMMGFAQTTVTYNMGNIAHFQTFSQGVSGVFSNAGTELGMYSNGGGTKNVVAFRNFKISGDNTGVVRPLQVGDIFSLQVYASSAFGQIGFSLNTNNVTTDYGTRNANSRLYVQEDGTNGSWYVNSAAGNETLDYNVNSTYRNYLFKIYITSETTCDVELIVDGTTTKRLFNRTMNGPAGANITGFALYMSDDWNGSANANVYWKQVTEVRANTSVNLGYYLTSDTFTPGKITDGLASNSIVTPSVNALNIGGDSGTTVILNQTNTYTGATTINAFARGEAQNVASFGNTSGITVSNNGALSLYSPSMTIFNSYPLTLNGNGQNGADGALRGVGGTSSWPGAVTLGSSSRINADFASGIILSNVNVASGHALTVGGTGIVSITGVISGTGTLIKDGTGGLDLFPPIASSLTGVTIESGTVAIATSGSLGSGTVTFPASGSVATLLPTNGFNINNPFSILSSKVIINTFPSQTSMFTNVISGSGKLTKMGQGAIALNGINTFSGGVNIGDGMVSVNNSTGLGSGTITLGVDVDDVSQPNNIVLHSNGTNTFAQPLVVGSNVSGASRTVQSFLGATKTFTAPVTLNGTLTVVGNTNFSNAISGIGGLTINSGLTNLSGANTYSGNTTLNSSSVLMLGADNTIPDNSNLVLNGGTFNSGGRTDQINVLRVDANSTISFVGGSHALTFANSSGETWSGTLTISAWNGTPGQSNIFGGRLMVGVGGLSAEQLAVITFQGYSGTPIILPSGELVPPAPSLAITEGETDHGSVCVESAATTVTYTITNTGGDAFDVSVQSDNSEFAVGNLSSTTIAFGETATFDVTFTPATSGTRTAQIMVSASNSTTNATSNLTGFGIAQTAYYVDADADGFGEAGSTPILSCTAVDGRVTNDGDCDDSNAGINPDAIEICDGIDNDCDGLTDGDDPSLDGSSASVFYADSDADGYGDAGDTGIFACVAPVGYVDNNGDCDDSNGDINPEAAEVCDGVDNDCNGLTDGDDPNVNGLAVFYADADDDGYGDNATQQMSCAAPAGYVSNNTDCDDTKANVNPAAVEIGYNLIDDDCDGQTDEGFAPKVTVVSGSQCNNTLATIDTPIIANLVAGAQGYRWRITNMNGPNIGQVQILDTALRTMKLIQLPSYAFATQYKVEVAVYYAGYLQPFALSSCLVSTPEAVTSLSNCNQALTAMSNVVYANIVPYAAGYRFRITDPVNPTNTQVLERPIRDFRMTQITNFAVQFGKAYNVEVSIKNTDGSWMAYGSSCVVNTPVFPTTSLQDSQCDNFMVPTHNTQIYATSYPGAIAYAFRLSGGGLPAPIEVVKPMRTFTLNDFAGQLTPGATYNVNVRLIFNLADPAGPYGKTCSITVPGLSRIADTESKFDAVAYPNPFVEAFNLDVVTSMVEPINVRIYDMTGRLLEDRSVKAGSEIQIGGSYPSGIYNIIVTQGAETKILRVIKR